MIYEQLISQCSFERVANKVMGIVRVALTSAKVCMPSHSGRVLTLGFVTLLGNGCGGADPSVPIMVESKHSNYHVHAVDASHEHTHDDATLGGHEHSHQHPDK